MQTSQKIPQYDDSHYAVVDLGSNSFHLSIIQRQVDKRFKIINKVKQKVRLASGLNDNNVLSTEAINRGLACLSLFAQHLKTLPVNHIVIVATATLRLAKNRDDFIKQANVILPKNIQLLSGIEEAETIFLGATCTPNQCLEGKLLVVDIGGASTELIIGENAQAKKAISLDIGCVSFIEKYFVDGKLTVDNFSAAIMAASQNIQPIIKSYQTLGWQTVVGSSGTMQALAEILASREQAIMINSQFLQEVKQSLMNCQHIDKICFEGLRADRTAVLASGLAILIALFECLSIDNLQLSTGALREGLLYKLTK
jgi:exopolyphosphatase/guanosine-5'-triphosphate,3'-diphosphate pyrophosphatase